MAWHSNRRRLFQLTPSRRATACRPETDSSKIFQLTPSRRATDGHCWPFRLIHISTHALTEGDRISFTRSPCVVLFQLTPSRRATSVPRQETRELKFQLTPSRRATNGENSGKFQREFQLTPSRRATNMSLCHAVYFCISTHALTEGDGNTGFIRRRTMSISTHALTEGDWIRSCSMDAIDHFNSRPHGGRQEHAVQMVE